MGKPMRCPVHDKVYTGDKCPLCAKGQGPATNQPVRKSAVAPKPQPVVKAKKRVIAKG